jgi:hypothetical protein
VERLDTRGFPGRQETFADQPKLVRTGRLGQRLTAKSAHLQPSLSPLKAR